MPARNTKPPRLSLQRAKYLLKYDSETGTFRWRVHRSGSARAGTVAGRHSRGYLYISLEGKRYRAHRLAWWFFYERWPEDEVDHINGVPDDNRIVNLRSATRSQNMANRKEAQTNSKTGVRGVYPKRRGYAGQVRKNGKNHHIGMFATIEEAARAVREKRAELFGEFAGE